MYVSLYEFVHVNTGAPEVRGIQSPGTGGTGGFMLSDASVCCILGHFSSPYI